MNFLKHNFKKMYYLFVISTFFSCQKVINIDINSKDPQIVIEAVVTDDTLISQMVKITKSVNINDDNSFPNVSGASVKISDNAGNNVTLSETSSGVYENSTLHGFPGRTYFLTVVAEGKTFTAVCTMPQKVSLDSVIVNKDASSGGPGGQGGPGGSSDSTAQSLTPVFHDPIGIGNNYRFKLKKGNTISTSTFLFNDETADGGTNNRPLNDRDIRLSKHDTIQVIMMCIDKAVYKYFYSMSQNGSGPNASATPANPVTNISGATLGYFSAHSIQIKKVVIQ